MRSKTINVDLTCEECASITKSGVPGSLCSVCGRGRIVQIPRRQEEEDRRVEAEGLERDRQAAEARARSQAEEREASRRDAFSRRQAEARAQHEANERKRHVAVLASVRKQVANGYLEAAGKLFGSLGGRRFAGLEYGAVEKSLTKAQAALAEVEGMLEVALEALKEREAEVAKVTGLLIFPPVGRLRKHRMARLKAAEAMAAGVKYVEQLGGFSGEKIKRILGEARDIDQRIALSVLRLGRMVEVLGVLWAIVVTTGGLMFQQHLAVQERERQRLTSEANAAEEKVLAEAKVEVTAEERERQRLALEVKAAEEKAMALAKAKVEAAETVFASKLGLSKPFVAGDRGRAGDLAVRWVPSGRFTMGSPSSERERGFDEEQHEAVLTRGFFLAETECTQGQWESVMGGNPSRFKGSDRPVEQVSWGEAVEYCRKLTAKQRAEGILADGWEWRLPTEAEWEYAARAGTAGARYGELDAIAWWSDNSGNETHSVSQKAANAWGLQDMIGNVWEWCSDWYGDYPTGIVTDPMGPSSGSNRVYRGGSWFIVARYARSADRYWFGPGLRGGNLGFRPALSSVR